MGKMSTIGSARRRLALQAPGGTPDDAGGVVGSFVTVATLWAEVRWLGGDERWRAARPEQVARYQITIRWRPVIQAGMRLTGQNAVYGIVSIGDPVGDRRRLVCLCEEIAP